MAVPAIAQPGEAPHGVAEWVAGLELWMLGGISGIFVLVYGWLLLTVLDARDRITKLEGWRDATRERLESGKASMSDLKEDIGIANARLHDIGGDLQFIRGKLEAREDGK